MEEKLRQLKVDVVVVSPLRRAIVTMQTCKIVENKKNEIQSVVVHPLCTERLGTLAHLVSF